MMLRVDNIGFERQFHFLFQHISFELHATDCLVIQGPNGCGKSTLLRMLAGFIEPSIGTVQWQNPDDIAYLGHNHGIKLALTVLENLKLHAILSRNKLSETAFTQLMQKMGLYAQQHQLAKSLSAGQLRRLALAKIVLQQKKIWILDEATTAFDTAGNALFLELLETHLAEQGIAVLASHHSITLNKPVKNLSLDQRSEHAN